MRENKTTDVSKKSMRLNFYKTGERRDFEEAWREGIIPASNVPIL